jgi:TPR repeat protein
MKLTKAYTTGQGPSLALQREWAQAKLFLHRDAATEVLHNAHPGPSANLGYAFRHGVGMEEDHELARRHFLKAAGFGDSFSQNALGAMYYEGLGGDVDYTEARRWHLEASNAADPNSNSEFVAAGMCYEGVGGPVDHARALRLWQSSAEHGVTAAYVQLGSLYRLGHAVTQDMQRARRYYDRALKVGDPEAEAMLELLGQDIERLCPLLEKRVMVINTDWDDLNRYSYRRATVVVSLHYMKSTRHFRRFTTFAVTVILTLLLFHGSDVRTGSSAWLSLSTMSAGDTASSCR